ncbi:MAG: Holliday junction resolvase RuvX [Oligoflexia bacterium]|nr:Holliday junction resolvase RuvX [Oligoflexia bacterium]
MNLNFDEEKIERFRNQNILTIDYGTKVVGLASFCPGKDPFPMTYGRIIVKDDLQVISELKQVIEDEFFEVLILGLPLFTDGKESEMTQTVRNFGKLLEKEIGIEPILQDETLSSFEAEKRMQEDPRYNFKVDPKKIDEVAACIILEDFFKKHG